MVRTQSIISVSDEVGGASQLQKSGSASNIGRQENNVSRESTGGVRKSVQGSPENGTFGNRFAKTG